MLLTLEDLRVTGIVPVGTLGGFEVVTGMTEPPPEPYLYTSLLMGADELMDDSLDTLSYMQPVLDYVNEMTNLGTPVESVLLGGLGLGCLISGLLKLDSIVSIDVLELYPDVIDLVGPAFTGDPRVNLVQADVTVPAYGRPYPGGDTFPPEGTTWDLAWFDTWGWPQDDPGATRGYNAVENIWCRTRARCYGCYGRPKQKNGNPLIRDRVVS